MQNFKPETQTVIAFLIIVSFLGVVMIWIFHPPSGDPAAMAVLTTLTGILGSQFANVGGFYFGSSSSSKTKDDTISKLTTGTGNGNAPPAQRPPTPAA